MTFPTICELHRKQQEAQGTNYELPWLWTPQFPVVLVGIGEDGQIHNCFYVERTAELRFVGCDAKALAFSRREADSLSYILKSLGYRYLECFVPKTLKKLIRKPLLKAGFSDKDEELSYFSRDLR